jgi:hypothetical protein
VTVNAGLTPAAYRVAPGTTVTASAAGAQSATPPAVAVALGFGDELWCAPPDVLACVVEGFGLEAAPGSAFASDEPRPATSHTRSTSASTGTPSTTNRRRQ